MKQLQKKGLILLLFIILATFNVWALDIDVQVTPVQDKVVPSQNAIFKFEITNNERRDITFSFSYLDIYWRLKTDKLIVEAQSTKAIDLVLESQKEEKPDLLTIIVASSDKTFREEKLLKVNLLDYRDAIRIEPIIPEPLDPRKSNVIKLKILNLQDFSFSSLRIKIESEFFGDQEMIDLDPFETRTLDFPIDFDVLVEEGSYPMKIQTFYNDKLIKDESLDINIGSYPELKEIVSPKSGLLYKRVEVTKENKGNADSFEFYSKEVSLFQRLFTDTQPKATKITRSGNGYIYSWQFKLEPGDTRTIVMETDYRWPTVIAIIILILAFIIYYFTKSDISVSKKVMDIVTDKSGITKMKVVIHLKNKSLGTIRNVKVMDKLPIVINNPDSFGTAHPKLIRSVHGTKLIWDIVALSKKEERIFSYNASYKLNVIGQLNIPRTLIRYRSGVRNVIVRSKPIRLFH